MARSVAVFSRYSTPIITILRELLPLVHFIEVQPSDPSPLKNAEIILGDYDWVGPHLYDLPKVKWIQGTWAGIDDLLPYISKDSFLNFPFTRTSGDNLGNLMSEYVIGNIVFWERRLFMVRENQKERVWDETVCPYNHRSFGDLKIGILGIGSIGSVIGSTLSYLGATIYGYGRTSIPLENQDNKYIVKYYTEAKLPELLGNVDYIVNVLPLTEETNNLLGNGILETCKDKNVVFINIGRGNVIKEAELVQALKKQWISGAILDVFETEPLPKNSELWSFPNVIITPHIAGNSQARAVAESFKTNLDRFQRNEALLYQIDFVKGY